MPDQPAALPERPDADPWAGLRAFTAARIALGRTGSSVPLHEALAFRLAHAHARDAVYSALDAEALLPALQPLQLPVLQVHSQAPDRLHYLQRPDLGRRLAPECQQTLSAPGSAPADVVLILADGLSAEAVNRHAAPVLALLVPRLQQAGFRLAPLVIAEQARVALSDDIGAALGARLALMFIGERPGLSAPDSLGAYLTFAPKPGLTDEARNCVSNIRPEGLPYPAAAEKLQWLVQESLRRGLSGVQLKDETELLGQ